VLHMCNPGRTRDEDDKATSQITADHLGDIKYFIPSGVECRMFPIVYIRSYWRYLRDRCVYKGKIPDHPGRCRQSFGCTLVVPGRSRITPDVFRDSAGM
jgi:hypothetical protein